MGLLAYCRPGFEGECAQELARDASGFVRAERGSGFVELVRNGGAVAAEHPAWRELIFARQLLHVGLRPTGSRWRQVLPRR